MFSKNLTDNMVFLGIEKIYSESTTKDLSDNIKVSHSILTRPNHISAINPFSETSRRILDEETYKN